MAFERVHTVWEYYDGPRTGLADYNGLPHYFACEWDQGKDEYDDCFSLSPIDAETLRLALEQWAIWRKWEAAFHAGSVSEDSHPGRGGRDARYDELDALLIERISELPQSAQKSEANFRAVTSATTLPAGVMRELEVEWRAK